MHQARFACHLSPWSAADVLDMKISLTPKRQPYNCPLSSADHTPPVTVFCSGDREDNFPLIYAICQPLISKNSDSQLLQIII